MKFFLVIAVAAVASGCASKSYMDSPEWQAIAQRAEMERFKSSTITAERNTVQRVNALETQVVDLSNRVCELEKRLGHKHSSTRSEELDRRFQKYMSK